MKYIVLRPSNPKELVIHPHRGNWMLLVLFSILSSLGLLLFLFLPRFRDRLIIAVLTLFSILFIFLLYRQTKLLVILTPHGISCNSNRYRSLLPWSNVKHVYKIVDSKDNHYLLFSEREVSDQSVETLWRSALGTMCVSTTHACFRANSVIQSRVHVYMTEVLADYAFVFHSQPFRVL